jgi:hypothetical protein
MKYTKKAHNYKNKTLRSYPKKNKITYTIEPNSNKSGDIYKKYNNGKLVKKVSVSNNKLVEIINKLKQQYFKKGGLGSVRGSKKRSSLSARGSKGSRGSVRKSLRKSRSSYKRSTLTRPTDLVVTTKDETTTAQILKQGFGFGLAFTAGAELMKYIIGSLFGEGGGDE